MSLTQPAGVTEETTAGATINYTIRPPQASSGCHWWYSFYVGTDCQKNESAPIGQRVEGTELRV